MSDGLAEYRLRCEAVGRLIQVTVAGGHFGTEDEYPNDSTRQRTAARMLADLERLGEEVSEDVVLVVQSAGVGGHDPYRPLLRLYRALQRRGLRLAVAVEPSEVSRDLAQILALVKLDQVIAVYPSAAAARTALGQEA